MSKEEQFETFWKAYPRRAELAALARQTAGKLRALQ